MHFCIIGEKHVNHKMIKGTNIHLYLHGYYDFFSQFGGKWCNKYIIKCLFYNRVLYVDTGWPKSKIPISKTYSTDLSISEPKLVNPKWVWGKTIACQSLRSKE